MWLRPRPVSYTHLDVYKRQALLAHFKTVAAVREASISDLEEVKGISHNKAEKLYNALHHGV